MSRNGTGQVGERVSPPVRLANHVSRNGGRSINELLCEAEHAIEALSQEFRELAKADLAQLRNAREGQSVQKIFEISHELRGLAGSFDLPMLTQVGTSLCDFVAQLESTNALCQEVVDLHIPGRGFDFVLSRTYRSRTEIQTVQGYNWGMSYDIWFERGGDQLVLSEVAAVSGDAIQVD